VVTFAAYEVASFGEFRGWFQPSLRSRTANIYWVSNWKMFTHKARYHTTVAFEGRTEDGEWQDLPMHQWYPARWESGYRWERPAVRRHPQIQAQFLHLACQKSGMDETRLSKIRWKKRMGRMKQPMRNPQSTVLLTWQCGRTPPTPKGRVL